MPVRHRRPLLLLLVIGIVAAIAQFGGALVDSTAPATPKALTATAGAGSVSLTWAAVAASDLDNYVVEYQVAGTTTATAKWLPATTTSVTIDGLTGGAAYEFHVRAIDTSGNKSAYSAWVKSTPTSGSTTTPATGVRYPGHVPGKVCLGMSSTTYDAKLTELARTNCVRRSFGADWGKWSSIESDIRADHAAKRLPWVSFKGPGYVKDNPTATIASWTKIANGSVDADIKSLATMLKASSSTSSPIVVTFHHEPSNDAPDADGPKFAAAYVHMYDVLKAEGALTNVAFVPIIGDWLYNPKNNQDATKWITKDLLARTPFLGVDLYEQNLGTSFDTRLTTIIAYMAAQGYPGKMVGIGETGCTDAAFPLQSSSQCLDANLGWAKANTDKIGLISYFNSPLNSKDNVYWPLDENAAKLNRFRTWLDDPVMLETYTAPATTAPAPDPAPAPVAGSGAFGGSNNPAAPSGTVGSSLIDSWEAIYTGWNASTPNKTSSVEDMVRRGSTLYVVGDFVQVRSPAGEVLSRSRVAALNADTGALLKEFTATVDGRVNAVTVSPDGSVLFIGGEFSNVNGVARNKLAALDAKTGALLGMLSSGAAGEVKALATGGNMVYVGGSFSSLAGFATSSLGRLKVSGTTWSADTTWKPNVSGGSVAAIEYDAPRKRVFIGGAFTSVSGAAVNKNLAVVSESTGAALAWNGHPTDRIIDLDVTAEGVYAAQGGGNRTYAFDIADGNQRWYFSSDGDNQAVGVIGGKVIVGFHGNVVANVPNKHYQDLPAASRVTRNKGFMLDAQTGKLEAWHPDLASSMGPLGIWAIETSANRLYLGGDFTKVKGVEQQRIAMFGVS